MVNIARVRAIAKEKGIKIGYICDQLGMKNSYLADVANGKNSMSDERITKIAEILGTTHSYLTDQTDDPAPVIGEPIPKSEIERMRDMATDLLEKIEDLQQLKVILAALEASAKE